MLLTKIAIIGPTNCVTKGKKVKESLFKLKDRFDTVVLSGGNTVGIEAEVKEHVIKFNIPYYEFNPSFSGHNQYSFLDEKYFGKSYHYTQLIDRYDRMLRYGVDVLVFGMDDGSDLDKLYINFLKKVDKLKIKTIFI